MRRSPKSRFGPSAFDLNSPFEYRQLLITGVLDNGDRVDLTRQTKFEAPAGLVKVSDVGQVRPVADGKGEIKYTVAGRSGSIPAVVAKQKEKYEASFVKDVMPLISRIGCNAGTCHGSAQGKNGFQLSLRGYDPIFDHRASGRRRGRPAFQPCRAGSQPDAAQAGRGGPACRRRADPAGRAVLRAAADLDCRGSQARPGHAARRQAGSLPGEHGAAAHRHEAADHRDRHLCRRLDARR